MQADHNLNGLQIVVLILYFGYIKQHFGSIKQHQYQEIVHRLRKKPSESTFHGHLGSISALFFWCAVVNVTAAARRQVALVSLPTRRAIVGASRQVVMVMAGTRPKMKSFFGCHHAKVGFIKLRTSYVIWTLVYKSWFAPLAYPMDLLQASQDSFWPFIS